MDFVSGFPLVNGKDAMWVIVYRLTKVAHFIPIRFKQDVEDLESLYVEHIVRFHGVPTTIVKDWDPSFTSNFWEGLHVGMGEQAELLYSLPSSNRADYHDLGGAVTFMCVGVR